MISLEISAIKIRSTTVLTKLFQKCEKLNKTFHKIVSIFANMFNQKENYRD